jgi:hypothetical protein
MVEELYERKIRYVMVDGIAHVPLMLWRSTAPKRLESALMQIPTQCRRGDLNPYALAGTSPSS